MANDITIAAIAKNESRYLVEWIAFHLAIGVNKIIVYSNDTEDDQNTLLEILSAADQRIEWHDWPSVDHVSPQVSAYDDAVARCATEWIGFIDIDEFLVPLQHDSLSEWLSNVPEDVGSVHMNWCGFGSGGRMSDDYQLVTRAFEQAADRDWSNNHHFKSIARRAAIKSVAVHNIETTGRRCLSDFSEFETRYNGMSDRVRHSGIQVNHYQCKTLGEFLSRMRRGSANFPAGHPGKSKGDVFETFSLLDMNHRTEISIRRFDTAVDRELNRMPLIPEHPHSHETGITRRAARAWEAVRMRLATPRPRSHP